MVFQRILQQMNLIGRVPHVFSFLILGELLLDAFVFDCTHSRFAGVSIFGAVFIMLRLSSHILSPAGVMSSFM